MITSLRTPADIINFALVSIGQTNRIGNLYDGSDASKAALDVYGQARDDLLRSKDWGFAERNLTMTLLKQAPAGGYVVNSWSDQYPPLPWNYEYAYPDTCLKVRSLKPVPLFIPDFDPQPIVFRVLNDDSYTPSQKVICTNLPPDAVLTYTARITDITVWEPMFVQALAAGLGELLAAGLNPAARQIEAVEKTVETATAAMTQG